MRQPQEERPTADDSADNRPLWGEDDLLPLSALQHLQFCERQCALIHLEGVWSENRLTAEGRILHEHVHEVGDETRDGVRVVRGLRLHSLALGLYGVADVVEFHRVVDGGTTVPGLEGQWCPVVVEYKRGRPKPDMCDRVQLCAQALCLEEMLGIQLTEGSIFYGQPRRREPVAFHQDLRSQVRSTAVRLHELIEQGRTPPAHYESRCRSCSLVDLCMPQRLTVSVGDYLDEAFDELPG